VSFVIDSHRFGGGGAPPEVVQWKHSSSSGVTLDATPIDGNLLVLVTSGTTSYTTHTSLTTAGFSHALQANQSGWFTNIWSKIASSASATITVTEGLGTIATTTAYEFDQGLTLDKTASGVSVGDFQTATAGPTASLSAAAGVAVAGVTVGGSITGLAFSDGFSTDVGGSSRAGRAHKILSSSAGVEVTATWVTARNASIALAVFT